MNPLSAHNKAAPDPYNPFSTQNPPVTTFIQPATQYHNLLTVQNKLLSAVHTDVLQLH
jgi:hypothetical protein